MTENDLLAGIAAHPGELERWLILADWLEDHDDPRAELCRLRFLLSTEPDSPEHPVRLARQRELLGAGLCPVVPIVTNTLGMTFQLLMPGTFLMGSPASESGRYDAETQHAVTLTRPFYMGVFPVTVGEFQAFTRATDYQTEGRG